MQETQNNEWVTSRIKHISLMQDDTEKILDDLQIPSQNRLSSLC